MARNYFLFLIRVDVSITACMMHITKQLYTTRMMYIIGKTRDHDGYDGFDKHAVTFPVYAWMLYLNYMVKGSS